MSIVSYSLINKLYQGSREQALQDILHRYFSQAYCIVDYVYGFMVVNRMLLEQKAQTITTANRDLDFREIMMDVDFLLPDGAALRVLWLVGQLLGRRTGPRMLHNLNGTDFLPYVLDYLHASDYQVNIVTLTVYDPRINNPKGYLKKGALDYMNKHWPKFSIHQEEVLYGDTNYDQFDRSGIKKFLKATNHESRITNHEQKHSSTAAPQHRSINLFLNFRGGSYGRPHQQLFTFINKDKLKELDFLCMNQAATVDFRTGKETRAPKWIRALWLESLYRLFSNPKLNYNKFMKSFQVISLIIRKVIFNGGKRD